MVLKNGLIMIPIEIKFIIKILMAMNLGMIMIPMVKLSIQNILMAMNLGMIVKGILLPKKCLIEFIIPRV